MLEQQDHYKSPNLDVVVALICRPAGSPVPNELNGTWYTEAEYLVAIRPHGKYRGLLEFPGGKVERGETQFAALAREVHEEVGLEVLAAHPLFEVTVLPVDNDSPNARLFVWQVSNWRGQAFGAEQQAIEWQRLNWHLQPRFLATNRHFLTRLQLGPWLAVVNVSLSDDNRQIRLKQWAQLNNGPTVRLRLMDPKEPMAMPALAALVEHVLYYCEQANPNTLVIDVLPGHWQAFTVAMRASAVVGIFLPSVWQDPANSAELTQLLTDVKTLDRKLLIGAACHNKVELEWAFAAQTGPQADFCMLSQVNVSNTHPDRPALGWAEFAHLSRGYQQACYALGGMQMRDFETAMAHGAAGIAAIEGFAITASDFVEQRSTVVAALNQVSHQPSLQVPNL